ncbi:hypothetical protein [Microvirga aerophila]|uniref:Uncharacterized protein n=1 Tax=Microvirga aerophila TaxID=670291 RepID=A0A512BLZ2_9HYPH|nr:hypothetical protein [Microvirga aerophila]GEO12982.1 hypothetical protein MAE02_06780 [Microvirga aerophila]
MRPHRRPPKALGIRFPVKPRDIPVEKAARRLHLTCHQFEQLKGGLYARGFPQPDPDTGMYDLKAINRWCGRRHPELFPELTLPQPPDQNKPISNMGERFRAAQERKRHG